MTAFSDGPCEAWEPIWCDGQTPVTGAPVTAASEILWAATGRRFGTCTLTVRPCRRDCAGTPWPDGGPGGWPGLPAWTGGWTPALIGGAWFNLTCGCGGGCSCASVEEVALPAPVAAIVEVRIDGAAIPTGSYRVDDRRLLVRTDGGTWPLCNDLGLDDTEAGTWSVTLTVGEQVPAIGRLAVAELAVEVSRACAGEDCRLPRSVATLVRQGVTIELPDPAELAKLGLFGLTLCDRFIAAYNPHRLASRSRAYSVDGALWRRAGT